MTGGEVAKNRGLWADLQRELARRQRQQQQTARMEAQAATRARREYEQTTRTAARQATADAKERKRLYVEARKAEAASMASELRDRIAELDSVLTASIRQHSLVTFASLVGKTVRIGEGGQVADCPSRSFRDKLILRVFALFSGCSGPGWAYYPCQRLGA